MFHAMPSTSRKDFERAEAKLKLKLFIRSLHHAAEMALEPWDGLDLTTVSLGPKTNSKKGSENTPLKMNIEPENDSLEDDFPFPRVYSLIPCSSSGVEAETQKRKYCVSLSRQFSGAFAVRLRGCTLC